MLKATTKSRVLSLADSSPLSTRDKLVLLGGVGVITALCWAYMIYMAWAMAHMDIVAMWMPPRAGTRAWGMYDFWMLFLMWSAMMTAMMAPAITPFVLIYAAVAKRRKHQGQPYVPTAVFLSGYLASWVLFSVVISLIQWSLHGSGLLDPVMNSQSQLMSGLVLVLAGVYQWTLWKDVCLHQCRTPLNFVMTHWREGPGGALRMGLSHGVYCIGCCWALMAVFFAVGVMNILWMALISLFVLTEKFLGGPSRLFRAVTGLLLTGWGLYWILQVPGTTDWMTPGVAGG